MFFKPTFAPIILFFFLVLTNEAKAMHQYDLDENNDNHCMRQKETHSQGVSVPRIDNLPVSSMVLPEELTKEIFYYLKSNDLLPLRGTSKGLKERVDQE